MKEFQLLASENLQKLQKEFQIANPRWWPHNFFRIHSSRVHQAKLLFTQSRLPAFQKKRLFSFRRDFGHLIDTLEPIYMQNLDKHSCWSIRKTVNRYCRHFVTFAQIRKFTTTIKKLTLGNQLNEQDAKVSSKQQEIVGP